MSAFVRWVADWRTGAVIVATVLVSLLGVLVLTGIQDRGRALDAAINATASEREARVAAVHRIDQLLQEIGGLQGDAQANGAQIARLTQEVIVLERQVEQLGGRPVVVEAGGSGPAPGPAASRTAPPRPTPRPSPTRTRRPSPSPSPSRLCVLFVCP